MGSVPKMPFRLKISSPLSLWPWLIIGLTLLIYGSSLQNGFIWDDDFYVWNSPYIKSWNGLKDIWFHNKTGEYYPITLSTIWLEYRLWGARPWGYHAVSLILHILNALLFFGLIKRWQPRLAGVTALLFAIHPIQVETVAWISEQKTLGSLFFFLLTFHSFIDFDAFHKKKDYAKTLLFFTAALLCKATAVCFVFIPLLWPWWKRGFLRKQDWLRALPFFVLGGAAAMLLLSLCNFHSKPLQIPPPPLDLLEKTINAGRIFFFYIRQTFFPQKFMTFYPWPLPTHSFVSWLYPTGVLALYTILFANRRRLGRGAFALLFFYGGSIVPVLGFIYFGYFRFSYAADHFTYCAVPALLILLCSAVSVFTTKLQSLLPANFKTPLSLFVKGTVAIVLLSLSLFSFRLTQHYKDVPTFWKRLLTQDPGSSFAYYHLGCFCRDHPETCSVDQAILWFEKAFQYHPDYLLTTIYLGDAYRKKGLYEKALRAYQQALPLAMPFKKAFCLNSIAEIHLSQKQPEKAIPYLTEAIALGTQPEYQRVRGLRSDGRLLEEAYLFNMATAHFMLGEYEEVIQWLNQALALNPERIDGYLGQGAAFMNLKNYAGAAKAFQEALRLAPNDQRVKKSLEEAEARLNSSLKEPLSPDPEMAPRQLQDS